MSRRKKHEEHENHERWLVSYADFITLLFAFFVVLYATSTQNVEKEKKFEESIRSEFKMAGSGQGAQNPTAGTGQSPVIDPLEMHQRPAGNQQLEDGVRSAIEKKMSKDEQKKYISDIRHDEKSVRISLAAEAFFPSGSSKILYPALQALDKIAEVLKQSKYELQIEGHTDNVPYKGGPDSNWELASLRATSVLRYFTKYHKIEPQRLSAISFADQKPVAQNDTEENRAKNRRVELVLINKSPLSEE